MWIVILLSIVVARGDTYLVNLDGSGGAFYAVWDSTFGSVTPVEVDPGQTVDMPDSDALGSGGDALDIGVSSGWGDIGSGGIVGVASSGHRIDIADVLSAIPAGDGSPSQNTSPPIYAAYGPLYVPPSPPAPQGMTNGVSSALNVLGVVGPGADLAVQVGIGLVLAGLVVAAVLVGLRMNKKKVGA